jgi:twitching motility protein PilU
MWRLQNDFVVRSQPPQEEEEDPDDQPSFTEITLDVKY